MIRIETFEAKIYLGLKRGYDGVVAKFEDVANYIQQYADDKGICVTLTQTYFIYTVGNEPGVIVGLINYPRFPKSKEAVKAEALQLAADLKDRFYQKRVSVVCSDETIMLGPK